MKLVHPASGRVLAERLDRADNSWTRFVGLMGRPSIEPGYGLWIEPCNSIHMFFMRFAIDAVFLDRDLKVRRVVPRLKPWRVSPVVFGARSVVELPAGTVSGRDLEGQQLQVA